MSKLRSINTSLSLSLLSSFSSFKVIHCSSEDEEFPASELNQHSPSTRGWQSKQFCDYPQELGFRLDGYDTRISQIQVLSHQCLIASRIEVFIGQGTDYHTATFKRLGFLSLDNNERSAFKARELKTVHIDRPGNFIRLLVHRCFVNKYNNFMQVGIVAVNFLGIEDEPSAGRKSSPRAAPPVAKGHKANSLSDLSMDLNLDQGTASKLRLLSEAKARAVESEDYHTAKQIKLVEGELRELGAQLAQLDIAKRRAVNDEDYDRAAALKEETDSLRQEIEDKVTAAPAYLLITDGLSP
jgi:centrosomal protein CEP104